VAGVTDDDSSRLSGLMSRWHTPLAWMCCRAIAVWLIALAAKASEYTAVCSSNSSDGAAPAPSENDHTPHRAATRRMHDQTPAVVADTQEETPPRRRTLFSSSTDLSRCDGQNSMTK
jgi:hypothetical protein